MATRRDRRPGRVVLAARGPARSRLPGRPWPHTGWTPRDLPGLILWLDARTGVTVDGSSNVTAWLDQSPAAYNFTQADSGRYAQLVDGVSGRRAVRLTRQGSPNIGTGVTHATWGALLSGNNTPYTTMVHYAKHDTGQHTYTRLLGDGTSAWLYHRFSGTYNPDKLSDGAVRKSLAGGTSPAINVPTTIIDQFDGTLHKVFAAGVQQFSEDYALAGNCTFGEARIGYSTNFAEASDGDLFAVVAYNRALNDRERMQLEAWAAT